MAFAPLSDPVIAAVADLFHQDRWQPSHDDLTVQFKRVNVSHADPRNAISMVGKRKRARGVSSTPWIRVVRTVRVSLRI